LRARRLSLTPLGSQEGDIIELIAGRPIGAVSALDHFGVEVPSPETVELIHERAVEEGVRVLPPRDTAELRRCVVFDPDGYKVEIFSRRCDLDHGPLPGP
jgi:catechol 2,3-dioxygenase-like lactoylglutathione lyase family enzyme